jgi:preprotein translocase subunit SecE
MDNRKIIIASYVATGMVFWFLTRQGLQALVTGSYSIRKLPSIGIIREFLPVVVGLAAFAFLMLNSKVNNFLDEVVVELKKVTWPSREDVVKSTIVVLGCVLFASGVLAVFDVAFGKMISYLLHS